MRIEKFITSLQQEEKKITIQKALELERFINEQIVTAEGRSSAQQDG